MTDAVRAPALAGQRVRFALPPELRSRCIDHAPFLIACAVLVLLLGIYAAIRPDALSATELNADAAAAMALLLAGTGQTLVLLLGGIDLSIGGVISLSTALAATGFGDTAASVAAVSLAVLALGALVGLANGVLIAGLRLQPFLVTLATSSITGGTALMVLPTEGGHVPDLWTGLCNATPFGLSSAVFVLAALLGFWAWFRLTRLGLAIRACGSNARSAFLSGVSLGRVNLATYGLSGAFAALAGLFLTGQTGSGSPTVGADFVLPSVAAAVIGGVSLFGGRGGLMGTVVGGFILTIIGNLVFVLRVSTFWQPIVSGVILLGAVVASSLAERSAVRSGGG
jgi:ribose transport system permease protein